jgi:hypothetical protein
MKKDKPVTRVRDKLEDILVSLGKLLETCQTCGDGIDGWCEVLNGLNYSIGALKNIRQKGESAATLESPAKAEPAMEPDGASGPPVV